MNAKWRFVLTLVIGFAVIGAFWFFSQAISAVTGYSVGNTRFDEFAKCLADSGVVLYISAAGCESCGQQKTIFKSSYQFLNIVNCDIEKNKCEQLEIKSWPAWVVDGKKYFGLYGVPRLSEISGCPI